MGVLKQKKPRPAAYCWNYYQEMSLNQMRINGCRDPEKQRDNPDKVCKWLQMYGEKSERSLAVRG